MSEFQNKAVELTIARFGLAEAQDAEGCRDRFLKEAVAIFRALGGSPESAMYHFREAYSKPSVELTESIGELMGTVAGISRLSDIDMMQAAYNCLDEGWKEIEGAARPRIRARG